MKTNFLKIDMFKALTLEAKKDEYKNLSMFIATNFDEACTEHLDLQRAYNLELKKSTTSQKHKALNDCAKAMGEKVLRAFRGHDLRKLVDKKAGETLKIVFDIDVHGRIVDTSLSVKKPKRETKKAVQSQGSASVVTAKGGQVGKLIG
tara:strand:+ start:316 stop:759 length:444 start_codon:yes stop_codon:yes gene_type:complete